MWARCHSSKVSSKFSRSKSKCCEAPVRSWQLCILSLASVSFLLCIRSIWDFIAGWVFVSEVMSCIEYSIIKILPLPFFYGFLVLIKIHRSLWTMYIFNPDYLKWQMRHYCPHSIVLIVNNIYGRDLVNRNRIAKLKSYQIKPE